MFVTISIEIVAGALIVSTLILIPFVLTTMTTEGFRSWKNFTFAILLSFVFCIAGYAFVSPLPSSSRLQYWLDKGVGEFIHDLCPLPATWVCWWMLVFGSLLWKRYPWQPKWSFAYFCLTAVTTLVSMLGLVILHNHQTTLKFEARVQSLRDQYPFESLESRLPLCSAVPREREKLSDVSQTQLYQFDNTIALHIGERTERLQQLHEGSVKEFVMREGFGVTRMFGGYAQSVLRNAGRNSKSIPQPRAYDPSEWTKVEVSKEPQLQDSNSFLSLHFRNTVHFVNPSGFGFVKSRGNVAGFQPHQFNELLEVEQWKIQRLELVGLLLADQPRVYVSAELPRMQAVHEVPTRSLDTFEAKGLKNLQTGEHLFIRETQKGIRMLGAIRSVPQCLKCHGGQGGDLLGAFTYILQSVGR